MGATQLNGTQVKDGTIAIVDLSATGVPSSSTYLRGDNTWAAVSGGLVPAFNTYTTSQTLVVNTFNVFDLASASTATLPTAVGSTGLSIAIVWNSGSYVLTIATTNSQTINGGLASAIQYNIISQSYTFTSNGTNWIIT